MSDIKDTKALEDMLKQDLGIFSDKDEGRELQIKDSEAKGESKDFNDS